MASMIITYVINSILSDFTDFMASNKLLLMINFFSLIIPLVCLTIFLSKTSRKEVFLVDFACYKPPDTLMCSRKMITEIFKQLHSNFSEEVMNFTKNVMEKAGIGDRAYVAEAQLRKPLNLSMEAARQEAEMVMFGAIDELLAKTSVQCEDIGILIVNCSLFNAVPSLCTMIVHRYKLRENVASYNLSGMGCGAGLIAIGLAKQLLQVHHNQYALVVSTENITQNIYQGKERAKFLSNCLFRLGGAAILLSNRASDGKSSKYKLIHNVHNNFANCDLSYNCIFQEEDQEGLIGVSLSHDLFVAAANAITSNLTLLSPLILPLSEKIKFLVNLSMRRLHMVKVQKYRPKFEKCVDHFFPHAGGRKLLDALQKKLEFSDGYIEPARMSLYRFGNTSSSTIWYSMAYAEAKGRIKKGDLEWQIAFGAGFYCTSVVWRAMRDVGREEMNPWSGEIEQYPPII